MPLQPTAPLPWNNSVNQRWWDQSPPSSEPTRLPSPAKSVVTSTPPAFGNAITTSTSSATNAKWKTSGATSFLERSRSHPGQTWLAPGSDLHWRLPLAVPETLRGLAAQDPRCDRGVILKSSSLQPRGQLVAGISFNHHQMSISSSQILHKCPVNFTASKSIRLGG
jgi:hypothetical protein